MWSCCFLCSFGETQQSGKHTQHSAGNSMLKAMQTSHWAQAWQSIYKRLSGDRPPYTGQCSGHTCLWKSQTWLHCSLNKEQMDVSFHTLNPLLPPHKPFHSLASILLVQDIPPLLPLHPFAYLLKLKRSRSKTRTGPVLLKIVSGWPAKRQNIAPVTAVPRKLSNTPCGRDRRDVSSVNNPFW